MSHPPSQPVSAVKRAVLVTVGCSALGLGIAGIPLPLLPTTPFLLLAAWCFVRSSPRLHAWLLNHRVLGSYIKGYLVYKAISRRAKIVSVTLLWITIGSSAVFFVSWWWVRILLFCIASAVTIHILSYRTLTPQMHSRLQDPGG